MTRMAKSLWLLAGILVIPAMTGCNDQDCTESCTNGIHLYCDAQNELKFEECTCAADGIKCEGCTESCVNGVHTTCNNGVPTTENCTCAADGIKCETSSNIPDDNPPVVVPDNPEHPAVPVEECEPLTITGNEVCQVTGSGTGKYVLRGDVLLTDKVIKGGSVVVEGYTITYVGCDPNIENATVITCPDSVISPGLINAHDHITYSNQPPDKTVLKERFDHRHDWRKNLNGHTNHNAKGSSNNESAEMRQLIAGSTSVFGSGNIAGLQRNVDKEKIHDNKYPTYQTFPLGDSGGTLAKTGCGSYKYNTGNQNFHFGPHIGEGINEEALNELRCLSGEGSGAKDIFNQKLAIIHGVAATPAIIKKMANKGSSLIWSPRSNISLYGDTANVVTFDNMGVKIALGTDWTPSGSANMLREYACADFLNTYYFGGHFSDHEIWKMGTINAAEALGLDPVIGALAVGKVADIAMYAKVDGREAHRAVISAENKDVLLVMLDGQLVVGDNSIASAMNGSNCGTEDVCGSTKKICPNGTSLTYAKLKQNARYPLVFCGTPANEPTCVPQRTRAEDTTKQGTTQYDGNLSDNYSDPNDIDGDGIPNAQDNCPGIFNPVRPQDLSSGNKAQGDADGDKVGDACDAAPLDSSKQ